LFQDIDLEDREREIITKINGEKSIRDIFRESGLKAFETLKMVYFLFRLRMVEAVKAEGTKIKEEVYTEADVSGKTEDKGRYPASKASVEGETTKAWPSEGATQAPGNESRGQESGVRSQEESLDSESFKQRADASVEGEAPSGFAGGGGDASPCNRQLRRQKIIDVHNAMAGMDHYQILGLKKGASGDEVKKAYFRLAKEYHPDIHYQEGMDEMKGMLEAIFRKITESYDVLSVDQKKQEYDLYSVISKHERRKPKEEKTDVRAQSQYQRALDAFNKGDLREAVNSIEWAIRIEPTRPVYYTLLGQILSRIPGRTKDAENGFIKAIELAPSNPENYIGLGLIYKKGGMKQRAIKTFEEALVWDPENREAKKELEGLK
ncbi:MAG: DnaJ domain-containing protein, partial [Nitrospirae bacterium]|nr:DnaJ domain-containing protein [Nitrospirota bacterium]